MLTLALNAVAIVSACVLAWFLLKKQSLVAAGIGLVWIIVEIVLKLMIMPERGAVTAFFALYFSINGVRGAWAAHRKAQETPAEA
jgi:hypothetical protein